MFQECPTEYSSYNEFLLTIRMHLEWAKEWQKTSNI